MFVYLQTSIDFIVGQTQPAWGLEAGDRQRYGSSQTDNNQTVKTKAEHLMLHFTSPLLVVSEHELIRKALLCTSHPKPNSDQHLHGRSWEQVFDDLTESKPMELYTSCF